MKLVANLLKPPPAPALWVACLCADWCGSCRAYRERFEQVGRSFPDAEFAWIDIEDQADLVDPVEVENFPTLLVVVDGEARFFGSITPHLDTLQRLVQAQYETLTAPRSPALDAATALAQRLRTAA